MINCSFNFSFPLKEEANSDELNNKQMKGMSPDEHSSVMAAVCGLIALISFVGNLLLCVVILKRRSMLAKPYNVLIFNLAVMDMLTGRPVVFPFHYQYGNQG